MQKFENVDILACLDAVMKQNTGFYQSDFEIDKEIIHKAAASPDREDKNLLWLSRPSVHPDLRPGRIASGSATFFSKTPAHTTHGSSTGSRHATASLPTPWS